jgi:hypothetical protein
MNIMQLETTPTPVYFSTIYQKLSKLILSFCCKCKPNLGLLLSYYPRAPLSSLILSISTNFPVYLAAGFPRPLSHIYQPTLFRCKPG